MNRVRRTSRTYRIARAALLLIAAFGIASYIACGNDTTYAPLGKNTPPASSVVVAGNVSDASHTPVKKAVVVMEPLTNGVPQTALWLKNQAELGGKVELPAASDVEKHVTLTDEQGRYAFSGVKAGEYSIQVRADDHLGASYKVDVPQALLTLDTIIVDVNLTPTGTFSGVATLENGTTHSNIVVYGQGTSYVAVTDPTGAYALTDVPVGTYTVRATKSHYLDDSKIGTLTFAGQNLGLPAMLLEIDNNIAPVATITIPVQPMVINASLQFQAAGNDLDGSVVLYEWDWENDGVMDASSASPGTTNHTYTTQGNYVVKLRVTDNLGAVGFDAKKITIAADAVYMAAAGSDLDPGTQAQPVKTLAKAYQIAQINGIPLIKAMQGLYSEVPLFIGGINVEGGYSPTWVANSGYTTFTVGTSRATANAITTATTISRVEVTTTSPVTPSNSIAMVSSGSSLALVFNNCIFRASNAGAAGPNGSNGTPGSSGNPGLAGGPGACDSPGAGGSGGSGGAGAAPANCNGGAGGAGGNSGGGGGPGFAGGCGGFSGGNGGLAADPGQFGQNGFNGNPGAAGNIGAASSNAGLIVGSDWTPANGGAGTAGGNGLGASGGGGGGGQTCTFCTNGPGNGGGGGGGGATGGGLGGAGLSGYGSIAVLLIASSPTFQNCSFFTQAGGAGRLGGAGANGGTGGAGGLGGSVCIGEVGKGGNGGIGGNGGGGGGGAGGAGGPSIGIGRASGSAPSLSGNSFTIGLPGNGGSGGTSGNGGPTAPAGSTGLSGTAVNL